jgi:nucleotide-binding universal stress UspA family protein
LDDAAEIAHSVAGGRFGELRSSRRTSDQLVRKRALRSAEALLEGADIPYTSEVRRGYVPQEIVRYAKELNCNAIIMGTRGMGTSEQILGSIVRQVVALTTLPVTLVK